jgi:phenylalanyl-tRNA synthetase beta chain
MKVPLSWLKEHIDLERSAEEIASVLTCAGIEVDAIERPPLWFSGVIAARVRAVARHPNADRLRVATVFDGVEELQIVCGAPNCREGLTVALAPVGATLLDAKGKGSTIKRSKIRDVESQGMLCSEAELGLSDDHEGILELSDSLRPGLPLEPLYAETIFDISLTPNLGHLLSIRGLARELSALFHIPLKEAPYILREEAPSLASDRVVIDVRDTARCARYACRMLSGVRVGPSPSWLRRRLESCGVRSVNNVVDAANAIMLAYGQPLHAFDYDTLGSAHLIVDSHVPYPSLLTLDDKLRAIPEDSLVVCTDKRPLAFAGVMGGADSAVSEETTTVLLEAALFAPSAVRATCRALALKTDASYRFERGVDPEGIAEALDRAAALIQEVAGGNVLRGRLEWTGALVQAKTLSCRTDRVNALLGTALSQGEVASLLQRLNFSLVREESDSLVFSVPPYRHDISAEIDLIEEVARLYGYANIPKSSLRYAASPTGHAPLFAFENSVREKLLAEGLQECLTCDLISPRLAELTAERGLGEESLISVLAPSSVDQSVLRLSLLPGLLQAVRYNIDRQHPSIAAFEVDRIHFKSGDAYKEPTMAAIILTGSARPYHWDPKPAEVDFFDLKGVVENLLEACGIARVSFEPSHLHNFHPWRQARVFCAGIALGALGELHPATLASFGIAQRVFFAELSVHDMLLVRQRDLQAEEVPQFPGSERDWTVTLKAETPVARFLDAVSAVPSQLLESVRLLDSYSSEQLGADRKNLTFRFFYRDREKTVAMDVVEKEHVRLTREVASKMRDSIAN